MNYSGAVYTLSSVYVPLLLGGTTGISTFSHTNGHSDGESVSSLAFDGNAMHLKDQSGHTSVPMPEVKGVVRKRLSPIMLSFIC